MTDKPPPRYKQHKPTEEASLHTQLKSDSQSLVHYCRQRLDKLMAEKLWRLDTSRQIENYIHSRNQSMREDLDLRHSKSDIKLFAVQKATYLEEDIFSYFYPFCLINCAIGSAIVFRGHSFPVIACVVGATLEYVYFLFAFPVESWHFHKRACSVNRPYAQFLRDSYRERFPGSFKAKAYDRVDES